MGNFLETVIDWGISRERYWGTPLPVWTCADCGEIHVIGSIEELKKMGKNVPENIELHKPFIDAVHLNCPKCGGDMKREPEVIDCWFDSGSMPFAQWHYPFEKQGYLHHALPRQFHQRGNRPDSRLVLYTAGRFHLPVRRPGVLELHRAGPRGRIRTAAR